MGLILIDRKGKRVWCGKHGLHRGKRCPKCAMAQVRLAWGEKPRGYRGPVTMRELRKWGWVA